MEHADRLRPINRERIRQRRADVKLAASNTDQKKKPDESSSSSREDVIELMVDYWVETGTIFTNRGPFPFDGSSEEVLRRIETVVDNRWCHHEGYGYQAEAVRRALRKVDLKRKIEEVQKSGTA